MVVTSLSPGNQTRSKVGSALPEHNTKHMKLHHGTRLKLATIRLADRAEQEKDIKHARYTIIYTLAFVFVKRKEKTYEMLHPKLRVVLTFLKSQSISSLTKFL